MSGAGEVSRQVAAEALSRPGPKGETLQRRAALPPDSRQPPARPSCGAREWAGDCTCRGGPWRVASAQPDLCRLWGTRLTARDVAGSCLSPPAPDPSPLAPSPPRPLHSAACRVQGVGRGGRDGGRIKKRQTFGSVFSPILPHPPPALPPCISVSPGIFQVSPALKSLAISNSFKRD